MAVGLPHTQATTTTGGTSVDVIPAPASGKQHIVMRISVYNADTVAHDYTLRLYDGTNHNPIQKQASVAAGATVTFDHAARHVADGTTKKFTLVVNAAATTTESAVTASYIENT